MRRSPDSDPSHSPMHGGIPKDLRRAGLRCKRKPLQPEPRGGAGQFDCLYPLQAPAATLDCLKSILVLQRWCVQVPKSRIPGQSGMPIYIFRLSCSGNISSWNSDPYERLTKKRCSVCRRAAAQGGQVGGAAGARAAGGAARGAGGPRDADRRRSADARPQRPWHDALRRRSDLGTNASEPHGMMHAVCIDDELSDDGGLRYAEMILWHPVMSSLDDCLYLRCPGMMRTRVNTQRLSRSQFCTEQVEFGHT